MAQTGAFVSPVLDLDQKVPPFSSLRYASSKSNPPSLIDLVFLALNQIPWIASPQEKLEFTFEVWCVRHFEMVQSSPEAKDLSAAAALALMLNCGKSGCRMLPSVDAQTNGRTDPREGEAPFARKLLCWSRNLQSFPSAQKIYLLEEGGTIQC